ncbi:MAG: PAS domain S-box protein [Burkholderiales bacterium]
MTRARYATIRFPLGMSLVAIGLLIGVDGALVQTAAALGFALCGLALAFDSERSKVPISILGAAVALLGLVNAAAAPEFAIAFFTAGLVISFKNRASGSASLLALQLFWLVIFVVACGIFLGHLLNAILNIPLFEQVLGRYEVNRMGSAGLIVLCMMLFYSLRQTPAMVAFYEGRQDRQIAAQGIVLLVSLGLVAGMGGAGILAKEIMAGFEATLSDALEANARHFMESVASATGEADRIAELSDLQGDAGTLQARLQKILELQKAEGVRAIWVSDARGKLIAFAGERSKRFENRTKLALGQPSWLFWKKGLRLESDAPIYREGREIGEIGVETDLRDLDSEFDLAQSLGKSREVVVCAPDKGMMDCFPSRLQETSIRLPLAMKGHLLPMSHALSGKSGVTVGRDYRGRLVVAAYSPVGGLGLGMVEKVDADELYVPARNRLISAYVFLLAVSALASWLLYRRMHPLVRGLISAEAHARAILDNIPEGVVTTDHKGLIRSFNPSARKMFGLDAADGEKFFSLFTGLSDCPGTVGKALRGDGSEFPYEMAVGEFSFEGERHFVSIVRDLSESKRIELALSESQEKLRRLFELSPLGIALREIDGCYVDFNKAYEDICGYTAEELRTIDNWVLTPREYEKEEAKQIQSVLSTGRFGPYEKEYVRKDGKLIPIRLNGVLISTHSGRKYIWSIVEDMTETRRAEAARRESARYLENVLENLQTGVVVHAPDGSVNYMNAAAKRFFGFDADRTGMLIPEMFTRFLREDGSTKPREELPENRILADGQPFYNDVVGIQFEEGAPPRWALVNGFPDMDESGAIREVIVSFIDITDRKHAQQALVEAGDKLERLNRLYRILSRVNEATVRIRDRDSLFRDVCNIMVDSGKFVMGWIGLLDEAGEIIPVMHAGHDAGYIDLLKKTGLIALNGPASLVLKTGIAQICPDIGNDPRMAAWREEAASRGYRSSAGLALHLGEKRIGLINVYSNEVDFFKEDIVSLMQEIVGDVSFAIGYLDQQNRREQAEALLRQVNSELEERVQMRTRQLEAANTELAAFSYSVSHDLRAPLRSIDGFSEILLKRHAGQLDDTALDYLARVRRAAKRMGELIEDLLQLASVTRSEIRREEVDLSGIVESIIREFDAGERRIEWAIQPDIFVQADARLMKIAMENLIGNAWKFTSTRVDAKIEFGAFEQGGEKILYVRDNGAGFDMKYAGKLFGAFQRLHKAEEFEGTGIGLATVQRIIRRHDGRIWAEGEVNVGAAFYFTL